MTWNPADAKPQRTTGQPLDAQPAPGEPMPLMVPTVAEAMSWGEDDADNSAQCVPCELREELRSFGIICDDEWNQWRRRVTRGIYAI